MELNPKDHTAQPSAPSTDIHTHHAHSNPSLFRVRIVAMDHYMAPPIPSLDICWSELEGAPVERVPVIRIYGSTPAGQKTCLHLHKAFPYFYIPYYDSLPQDHDNARLFVRRLALALNKALSMAQGPAVLLIDPAQNPNEYKDTKKKEKAPMPTTKKGPTSVKVRRQFVYAATLVRGFPFYGYFPDEQPWIKLMFYDPRDVPRAASLLLAGAVLGQTWQPHEAHIPYMLQLKMDLNLQGMGWLTVERPLFRMPLGFKGLHTNDQPQPQHRTSSDYKDATAIPIAASRHTKMLHNGWAQRILLGDHALHDTSPALQMTNTSKSFMKNDTPSKFSMPSNNQHTTPTESGVLELSFLDRKKWTASNITQDMLTLTSMTASIKGSSAISTDHRSRASIEKTVARQSTCELELDGCVEHVIERKDAVKEPLALVGDAVRMVKSLAPMWEEEKVRCGGVFPEVPQDVPRTPLPLGQQQVLREGFRAAGIEQQERQNAYDAVEGVTIANDDKAISRGVMSLTQPACDHAVDVFHSSQPISSKELHLDDPSIETEHGNIDDDNNNNNDIDTTDTDIDKDIDRSIAAQIMSQPHSMEVAVFHSDGKNQHIGHASAINQDENMRCIADLDAVLRGGSQFEQEDLLMELAMHVASQHAADVAVTGALWDDGERGMPPNAEYVSAALHEMIASTQQECDDIVECSMEFSPGFEERLAAIEEDYIQQRNAKPGAIPQLDGAHDDDSCDGDTIDPGPSCIEIEETTAGIAPMKHQSIYGSSSVLIAKVNTSGLRRPSSRAAALLALPQEAPTDDDAVLNDSAKREDNALNDARSSRPSIQHGYVSQSEVRAASQSLSRLWRVVDRSKLNDSDEHGHVACSDDHLHDDVNTDRVTATEKSKEMSMDGHNDCHDDGRLNSQKEDTGSSLPSTQPIPPESMLIDDNETHAEQHRHQGDGDDNDGILCHSMDGAWWHEEASQIPFDHDDFEWDIMDSLMNDDGGDNTVVFADQQQAVPEVDILNEEVLPSTGDTVVFRYRCPAPQQKYLDNTFWNHDVHPVLYQGVHYSKSEHVPKKAPIFAGKEFKIPTNGVKDMPSFGNIMESSVRLMELSRCAHVLNGPRIKKSNSRNEYKDTQLLSQNIFRPVKQPPSTTAVNEWLTATESSKQGHIHHANSGGASATAGFMMDPNTGKLIPASTSTGPSKTKNNAVMMTTKSQGGSEQLGSASENDLLGTPSLSLPAAAAVAAGNPKKQRLSRDTVATPRATRFGGGSNDGGKDASNVHDDDAVVDDDNDDGTRHGEKIRPASPKYDEGSIFYSNPFVEEQPFALRGGSSSASRVVQLNTAKKNTSNNDVDKDKGLVDEKNNVMSAQEVQQAEAPLRLSQENREAHIDKGDTLDRQEAFPSEIPKKKLFISQITPPSEAHAPTSQGGGATPSSQIGFKRTITGKGEGLTLACVEIHAESRGQLLPDPRYDAVRAVVVSIMDDNEDVPDGHYFTRVFIYGYSNHACSNDRVDTHPDTVDDGVVMPGDGGCGLLIEDCPTLPCITPKSTLSNTDALTDVQMEYFNSEDELLNAFVAAIQSLDPDIMLGFEVQQASLGYMAERAAIAYERNNFLAEISRLPDSHRSTARDAPGSNQYDWQHSTGLNVPGRIVLNVWRLLRSELKLNIYTLENCAAAVLRVRIPHIPQQQLSAWFHAGPAGGRWRCLSHCILTARLSLLILDRLDIVGRTAEMARTFGIDFYSVLSRGSQYRVESMTLRLAHSQNYIALSPSNEQVARQPAMEALPLVMEPMSGLYTDPVCVLDFQSLYPSMIIAYNMCYSTCAGKAAHASAEAPLKMGCSAYSTPHSVLHGDAPLGVENLIIAPNGIGFVSPDVRPGILPRLLKEILDTRIMVKAAMKRTPPSSKVLLRCLNARQFGLKLIANVTYGYTAAGFSGRMPMAELADAIVQSGRETLENAIHMVEQHPEWRAKVIYGDTDSLFVQLPGRSMEDAFRIGEEIAIAVTASNPPPVKLKLEKVYRPCVLLSKKRYVGSMRENVNQKMPVFDAKGIETVRRDACPAVSKVLEKTIRILFATKDLSAVRDYLERQWTRILSNRVSISDFIFAKEVRLGTYSARAGVIPPAALVATRAMASDPRAEPRYGERVPYVVVHGEPGARLADMVVPPRALIESGGRLRLHGAYYITKQIIPAVERVISLVGADVRGWFAEMPRPQRMIPQKRPATALGVPLGGPDARGEGGMAMIAGPRGRMAGGNTIDRFYLSRHCAVCDDLTHVNRPICDKCAENRQLVAAVLLARRHRLEKQYMQLVRVCLGCGGGGGNSAFTAHDGGIVCDSLDCGVYFERRKIWYELKAGKMLLDAGLAQVSIQ